MTSQVDTLTVSEAADRLGKSRKTITRWITADKFPNAAKEPGERGDEWRLPVADVDAMLDDEAQTFGGLTSQINVIARELGQAEGQVSVLTSQVDDQARRLQQLTADLEHERMARQKAETDTARAEGKAEALRGRVSDLTAEGTDYPASS